MLKYEQTIDISGLDAETILAISYSALQQLNWTVLYAGDDTLQAATPKSWRNYAQQVLITASNEQFIVSSEMVHGETFDIGQKNKKHTDDFVAAFDALRKKISAQTISESSEAITGLRAKTREVAIQHAKDAKEVEEVMNLSSRNLYVTYAIMAINVLVFVLMVIDGAGLIAPNGLVHVKWGSNYTVLTESGDWWRLISNIFIHFGIIHLVMNMYCLYMAGVYLEPMLGKIKYTAAYLATGVLASVGSLWWHKEGVNSAGASGAIFGLYGLFLALLTSNLIPKSVRDALLKSIGIFIVYNLVYGMKSGVDNSAHVGGLVSGFIIGYIYVFTIKKERQGLKVSWAVPLVVLATIGISYAFLQNNQVDAGTRKQQLEMVKGDSKDAAAFYDNIRIISGMEDSALKPLQDSLTNEETKTKLKEISLPLWQKAEGLVRQMQQMDVTNDQKKKADNLLEYILLRQEQISILNQVLDEKAGANDKLTEIGNKIDSVVNLLK